MNNVFITLIEAWDEIENSSGKSILPDQILKVQDDFMILNNYYSLGMFGIPFISYLVNHKGKTEYELGYFTKKGKYRKINKTKKLIEPNDYSSWFKEQREYYLLRKLENIT